MRKILFAVFLSFMIFVILNFLYSNLNEGAFNYPMSFRFYIPPDYQLKSAPIPLGFIVISAFCLGMVFLAVLQAIPSIFKTIAIRAKDRRIRELEQELEATRQAQNQFPEKL